MHLIIMTVFKILQLKIVGKINERLLEKGIGDILRRIIVVGLYATMVIIAISIVSKIQRVLISSYHDANCSPAVVEGGFYAVEECECFSPSTIGSYTMLILGSDLIATIICGIGILVKKHRNKKLFLSIK